MCETCSINLVNLTGQPLSILYRTRKDPDADRVWLLQPAAIVPRIQKGPGFEAAEPMTFTFDGQEFYVPTFRAQPGIVSGMPPEMPGRFLIVLYDIAQHPDCRGRKDLLIPGPRVSPSSTLHDGFTRIPETGV